MEKMNRFETCMLAKGRRSGVDKARIKYALDYLYGNVEDAGLDRFSDKEVLKSTTELIKNRDGY